MTEPVSEIQSEVVAPEPKARKRNGDGRDVVKAEPAPPPVAVSEGDAFLAMIERAARDPSVDIDKMERLFAMRERMQAQEAKAAYLTALAEMQPKLPVITKHGTINANEKDAKGNKTGAQVAMTKYAKWEDINEAITPVLGAHGFTLTHRISNPSPDRVAVTAVLGHRAGHTEETSMALPIDATGAKNNVQGWGSSVQYGKRYTSVAILNITTRGEDDDANAGGSKPTDLITDAQCQTLLDKIAETQSDTERFCTYFRIEGVARLPASQFNRALGLLNQKGAKA